MRVWTRADERAAPPEVIQAYDKGVVDGQTKAKQVNKDREYCEGEVEVGELGGPKTPL